MGFILTGVNCFPFLLSAWCTLNTSYGGVVLSTLGLGGIISVGWKLFTGLPTPSTEIMSDRIKQSRKRRRTMYLGVITLIILATTVVMYFVNADILRPVGATCDITKASTAAIKTLSFFYLCTLLSALFSIWFNIKVYFLSKAGAP
jgi:hypothetical protein